VGARAERSDKLQAWLAAWLAALLAIAPFGSSLPVELAAVHTAVAEAVVADDHAQDEGPTHGLRPAQPTALGVLSRLSLLETALGLPPPKPPLLRATADQPVLVVQTTTALRGETRDIVHPGSVGTARTPTGPPS
jgi:hypothetical protein